MSERVFMTESKERDKMYLLNVQHLNPQYDEPGICERCGAPIANLYIVEDGSGEEHVFGSTCIKAILPKSKRWFELYLDALDLGIVDFLGREVVTSTFTAKDLNCLIKYTRGG